MRWLTAPRLTSPSKQAIAQAQSCWTRRHDPRADPFALSERWPGFCANHDPTPRHDRSRRQRIPRRGHCHGVSAASLTNWTATRELRSPSSSGIVTLRGTTIDTPQAARLNDIVSRIAGVVAIENEVAETTDLVARLNPAVDRFRTRLSQGVALLPLAAVALFAFAIVFIAGILLARMRRPLDRIAPNAFIANIYRQILRMVFFVSGLVIALDILGATALLGTILGAAGIVGLAIGFAVRDTVENFIASIMLSIRQPFRPNDIVEIEGDVGKVIRLTSRATILLSFDGNHIRIPNATVFKSRIVNYSTNEERRYDFQIGVASDGDLEQVRDLGRTGGCRPSLFSKGSSTHDLDRPDWGRCNYSCGHRLD